MLKAEIIMKLKAEKLVAVIRGKGEAEVLKTAAAVVAGGIHFLEITFTIPKAEQIIAKLADSYKENNDVIIGAGTCLDVMTARLAISAGAQFIVSPHFDKEILKLGNSYCIPVLPGAATVREMLDCLKYGAEIIKLFPGDLAGPKAIKSFKGPLPQADFMPTGGVTCENVHEWLENGAIAVGTGSSLTRGVITGDFKSVQLEAEKFVAAVRDYEK